jgi:hypothetical protein
LTSQGTRRPEDDEDTIELELTAEEMRGLSRAAKEAQDSTADYAIIESAPATLVVPAAGKTRFQLWPVVLAVAVVGVATAVVWRPGGSHREVLRAAPVAAPSSTPRAASAPVPAISEEPPPPQESQAPPLRVKNPFDPKEVFEFPAGTTRAEARRIVSELLLQRAVNRQSPRQGDEPANKPPANN